MVTHGTRHRATLTVIATPESHAVGIYLWGRARASEGVPDFSVVLFRPNFMLASEEYPMKMHKNQWLSTLLSSPGLPCGATNQGTHPGVWDADAFPVT